MRCMFRCNHQCRKHQDGVLRCRGEARLSRIQSVQTMGGTAGSGRLQGHGAAWLHLGAVRRQKSVSPTTRQQAVAPTHCGCYRKRRVPASRQWPVLLCRGLPALRT